MTTNQVSPYQLHDSAARLDMMAIQDASEFEKLIWNNPTTSILASIGIRCNNEVFPVNILGGAAGAMSDILDVREAGGGG